MEKVIFSNEDKITGSVTEPGGVAGDAEEALAILLKFSAKTENLSSPAEGVGRNAVRPQGKAFPYCFFQTQNLDSTWNLHTNKLIFIS